MLEAIRGASFKHAAKRKARALEQTRLDREIPPTQRFGALVGPASKQTSVALIDSLMLEMFRMADHRGSDVRLDVGVQFQYNARPRVSVDERRWVWKRAVTTKFHREAHINELELTVGHNALCWRVRHLTRPSVRGYAFSSIRRWLSPSLRKADPRPAA